MAKSKQSFEKRLRERKKQQKKREKADRKAQRKAEGGGDVDVVDASEIAPVLWEAETPADQLTEEEEGEETAGTDAEAPASATR